MNEREAYAKASRLYFDQPSTDPVHGDPGGDDADLRCQETASADVLQRQHIAYGQRELVIAVVEPTKLGPRTGVADAVMGVPFSVRPVP